MTAAEELVDEGVGGVEGGSVVSAAKGLGSGKYRLRGWRLSCSSSTRSAMSESSCAGLSSGVASQRMPGGRSGSAHLGSGGLSESAHPDSLELIDPSSSFVQCWPDQGSKRGEGVHVCVGRIARGRNRMKGATF